MFCQRKKVIVFFANVAFALTSIFPNSVTMGMYNLDTSASSSSFSSSVLQPNANNSQNTESNSSNSAYDDSSSSSESLILQPNANQNSNGDENGSSKCCERCFSTCLNCFCDDFVRNHPCIAISFFLLLGGGTVFLMDKAITGN